LRVPGYPVTLGRFKEQSMPFRIPSRYRLRLLAAIAALLFWLSPAPDAHEIPNDVTIQVFFKPEGQRLRLLLRAPLEALNDIDWPMTRSGMLDLSRADPSLRDAATLWLGDNLQVREDGRLLPYPRVAAVRASQPSDQAFQSYDLALAQILGPKLPPGTEMIKNQGMLDVLFEYSIASDQSRFSLYPRFVRLGIQTQTIVRFLPPGGTDRVFELHGDPGLVLLDPRWLQAAWRFANDGFFHILDGPEHVLFILVLLIPFRRMRSLVPIVTSFTVAHSVTLIASAFDMAPSALWFPPFISTLVAVSILYMAIENIAGPRLSRRWLMTFAFGLVHGFAFAFAFRQTMQFAGTHLIGSLIAFNVGLEVGQLLLLVLMVPALNLLFKYGIGERLGTVILSVLVAHMAWHWTWDRYGELVQYQFIWPVVDAAFLAGVLRWLMLLVILAGAWWVINGLAGKETTPGPVGDAHAEN
jgi:hypothetical protein